MSCTLNALDLLEGFETKSFKASFKVISSLNALDLLEGFETATLSAITKLVPPECLRPVRRF